MDRIRRLARKIVEEGDRRVLFDAVVDLAVESTGAERGLLVERDGDRLTISSARNVDQESLRGREARLSITIAREAMEQEGTVLLEDALKQEAFGASESVYELGLRSVLCVPVWLEGRPIAALHVDSRFIPGAFSQADAHRLETLADLLSLFLWKQRQEEARTQLAGELAEARSNVAAVQEQLDELRMVSSQAAGRVALEGAVEDGGEGFPPIIGQSEAMCAVYSVIRRVLDNDITVLVLGESGTGKELVARAIFQYGRRADEPFVAINCSSIPASLIESELFGHLKGSFTGATRDKKGLFEVADGGTIFLDEVGDMPLEMQGKLLRTLQYGEIQRVGGVETKVVDARVVAATNRNLEELVAQGKFREDLFYRLNIVSIEVPPLRRRKDDIPILAQHFIGENCRQGLSEVKGITPQGLVLLRKYPWPGNVRELETVLKSACLFAEQPVLDVGDFEGLVRSDSVLLEPTDASFFDGRTLAEIEKDVILATLKRNGNNKKKTAVELGIDRRTLYNKLKRYGFQFSD